MLEMRRIEPGDGMRHGGEIIDQDKIIQTEAGLQRIGPHHPVAVGEFVNRAGWCRNGNAGTPGQRSAERRAERRPGRGQPGEIGGAQDDWCAEVHHLATRHMGNGETRVGAADIGRDDFG